MTACGVTSKNLVICNSVQSEMMTNAQIQSLLQTTPVGFKSANDDFFAPGNASFVPTYKKLGVITNTEETALEASVGPKNEIFCNVPSCRRYFDSVASYQTHFNSVHRYICAQCKKSLPTPHLLDLHISEQHDSYFAARLARGEPMYACLLEECSLRLQTSTARKEHCIKAHKFPGNFRFDQFREGGATALEDTKEDVAVNTKSAKKSTFVFGHQKSKTFNSKLGRKKNVKNASVEGATLENLQSLTDALDGMS